MELNDRQRAFCDNLLSGCSQAEAYRKAGYNSKNPEKEASKLVLTPDVSRFLADMRGKIAEKSGFTRERAMELLKQIAEDGGQLGSARVSAITQAAKMCGWNEPDKQEHSGVLEILIKRQG